MHWIRGSKVGQGQGHGRGWREERDYGKWITVYFLKEARHSKKEKEKRVSKQKTIFTHMKIKVITCQTPQPGKMLNIMFSKTCDLQRTNSVCFYLNQLTRVIKIVETNQKERFPGVSRERKGRQSCLINALQFCRKKILDTHCRQMTITLTIVWNYLEGQFYVPCF